MIVMETATIHFPLLKFPGSLLVCGASHSGKSHLVRDILQHRELLFTGSEPITAIKYCYSQHPGSLFEHVSDITYHQGLPDEALLDEWLEMYSGARWILICDDLQLDFFNSPICEPLMTKLLHHRSLYFILIGHRIFGTGKHAKLANLNFHTMILCRQIRDIQQISILSVQLRGRGGSNAFVEMYLDATALQPSGKPGYLLISTHPLYSDRQCMFFSHILPGEGDMVMYVLP